MSTGFSTTAGDSLMALLATVEDATMRDTVFAFFTTFIGAAGFSVALGAMKQMSNEKSSAQCSKLEPKWLRSNAQDQSPCRFVTEPPNLLPVFSNAQDQSHRRFVTEPPNLL